MGGNEIMATDIPIQNNIEHQINWTKTMDLRWDKRYATDIYFENILQQKWIGDKGQILWVDIEYKK